MPEVPWGAPPEFERGPYLQAVTDSSAVVRWRAGREPGRRSPSLRFRLGAARAGAPWARPNVERLPDGGRIVRLTGLPADAIVRYRIAEAGEGLGPYRFRTAPAPTGPRRRVRVLAFGDSGWGSREQVTLAGRMAERRWDLAVHVGDLAYPSGSSRSFTLRHFRVYRELLARVPFFPSPGNHDVRAAGGRPYDRSFTWPGTGDRRYYRFRWGHVLFVALDTGTPAQRDSLERTAGGQYRWLEAGLRAASADSSVRWTVVYMHHPLYSDAGGLSGHGPDRELRGALRPLFERHGVDVVLAGHDHHYQRSRPLRDGEPVPAGCGPVYFVTGGGGASRFARTVEPGPRTAAASRRYHFLALGLGTGVGEGRAVGLDGSAFDTFRLRPWEPRSGTERCER